MLFSDSCLREIDEFLQCESLRQVEIPSSVEVIGPWAFEGYAALREIIFLSDSQIREIDGFR
jgi:hypothetical protein